MLKSSGTVGALSLNKLVFLGSLFVADILYIGVGSVGDVTLPVEEASIVLKQVNEVGFLKRSFATIGLQLKLGCGSHAIGKTLENASQSTCRGTA